MTQETTLAILAQPNQVALDKIRRDGGTQARANVDQAIIEDYAAALLEGAVFPPVMLFYDGTDHWLADGFHRILAAALAGLPAFPAIIRQGSQRDAILYSVGANATHGLHRSNDDKRRAVETLLIDEEWGLWSDGDIARQTGVSAPTVKKYRDALKATYKHLESPLRKGADGRTYDTTHIGSRKTHWSATPVHEANFWADVDRFRLERAAILDRLQPGCTSLRDLALTREETTQALERLAEERLRQSFPIGAWVVHTTVKKLEMAQVKGYGGGINLRVEDPHPGHYAYQWNMNEVRLATIHEVADYQQKVNAAKEREQLQSAAAGQRASALTLDKNKAHDQAVLELDWRDRVEAQRGRIPTKAKAPLLALILGGGHMLVGPDATTAAEAYKRKVTVSDDLPVLVGKESYWEIAKAYPQHNVYYYTESRNVGAERVYYAALMKGKADILPGDLVYSKKDYAIGRVADIQSKQATVDLATFEAGKHERQYIHLDALTLHQRWQSGEPLLDPGVRPPLPLPPTPWIIEHRDIKAADGQTVPISTWGGHSIGAYRLQQVVDLVNCPASAYTGDTDLAAALDRVGRLTASDDPQAYDELPADLELLDVWLDGIRNHFQVRRHYRVNHPFRSFRSFSDAVK